MKVRYHVLARIDVAEILEYYEAAAGSNVAIEFFDDLETCLRSISGSPSSYPEIKSGVRRILLRKFPYQINYEIVDAGTVRILVVKDQRRHPSLGMDRA